MQRLIDGMESLVSETVAMGRLAEDMLERALQAIADEDTEIAEGSWRTCRGSRGPTTTSRTPH